MHQSTPLLLIMLLQVLLNDRLVLPAGHSTAGPAPPSYSGTTSAGIAVSADVLLMATGMRVNTAFMREELANALDADGRLKVMLNSRCWCCWWQWSPQCSNWGWSAPSHCVPQPTITLIVLLWHS